MTKELKDYTLEEIKALGFDIKNQIEFGHANRQAINAELQRRAQELPAHVDEPKKKK